MWRTTLLLGLHALAALNPPAILLAQNPARGIKFEHFTSEHGLSQSSIQAILQDHQGFMWFGTIYGLNKYDGCNFTVYKHDPDDPASLSDDWIYSLYEDRSGVLWVGTQNGGLNKLDRETDTFTSYQHDPQNPNSLSDNHVLSIYEDRFGVLWIGTRKGGLNKLVPPSSASASGPELKDGERTKLRLSIACMIPITPTA